MHYNNEVSKIYNKEDSRLKKLLRASTTPLTTTTTTTTAGDFNDPRPDDRSFVDLSIFKK